MKPIPSLLPLLALAGAVSASFAATEFDDAIPADVVAQLIGAAFGGNARLYQDAPEGFPPFELPRGMSFLVGVDQGWSQRVILRSRVDHQASIALTYGVLLDSGWELIPMPGTQAQQTGFIDPNAPVPQTQLCHDDYGILMVSTQSGPGATYVNLNRSVQQGMPLPGCAQMAGGLPPGISPGLPPEIALRQQQRMAQMQQLQQNLPRLELPDSDGMSAPRGGYGGGSGGDNEWEVRAQLTGTWNMRRIYNHFAEQIEDQDWKRDARAIGDSSASGSWTKTVDDGVELVGSLSVLRRGDESYDLRFRMLRLGADQELLSPALGIRGIPSGLRGAPISGGIQAAPIGVTEIIRD